MSVSSKVGMYPFDDHLVLFWLLDLTHKILFRYPLTLDNGLQCKIIVGFGKTICTQLEERLQRHREAETETEATATDPPSPLHLNENRRGSPEERVDALKKKKTANCHLPSFPLSPVASKSPQKLRVASKSPQKLRVASKSPQKLRVASKSPPFVATKSPPFRQIENLQLSPARLSLLQNPLPITNSPTKSKLSLETQSEKSRQAALSSMASVFDSPASNGKAMLENIGVAEEVNESLEEREARELEMALALSQAEIPDQVFDSDFEIAKKLQKEEDERQRRDMEEYNTEELPDIEEGRKEKAEEGKEAEELELGLYLSQEHVGARSWDQIEEELPDVEMTEEEREARDLARALSLSQQMIGGEEASGDIGASSSGSQTKLSEAEGKRVGKLGGIGGKMRVQHQTIVRSPDRGEDEWASGALQDFFNNDKVFRGGKGGGRLKTGGKTSTQTDTMGSNIGNTSRGRGRKRTVEREELAKEVSTPARMKRKRGGGGTPSGGGEKTVGSGRKEYVPKTRSGAYAVLLTLAKEEADDSWRGHLLKVTPLNTYHICFEDHI